VPLTTAGQGSGDICGARARLLGALDARSRALPHRPWFKVAVNAALRAFQTRRRPARLLVLASVFEGRRLVGYGFARVLHLREAPACP
jgi:hypothetical protein